MTFVFVSGSLALDFVGTLKWRTTEPEELLASPEDLSTWALESGVLTTAIEPSMGDLAEITELREAIYRTIDAKRSGQDPLTKDVALVDQYLRYSRPTLSFDGTKVTKIGDASQLAAEIALNTVNLLTGAEIERIKECGRERCTRIFIDRSRNSSRNWCGMEECGNRVKAANYRRRKRATN